MGAKVNPFIILFRNPTNKRIGYISDPTSPVELAVFPDYASAKDFADNSRFLQSVVYQIVELDEL